MNKPKQNHQLKKQKRLRVFSAVLVICLLTAAAGCGKQTQDTESQIAEEIMNNRELSASTEIDVSNLSEGDIDRMFYSELITDEILARIQGKSFKENSRIQPEDLRYLRMLYVDIDGRTHIGEMIVNQKIAVDVLEIFRELYRQSYPIERMVLVDEYQADDEQSMSANNTSAFNYRTIENTDTLSLHSLGLAVDVNPLYNPYIYTLKDGTEICSPKPGSRYADRTKDFDYKIDKEDLAYKLFTEHGFTWGGEWDHSKDYQHFEKQL